MILTGENRRTRRKTRPSATLSTTNPTGMTWERTPGLRGEKPETNRLCYGTTASGHYFTTVSANYSTCPKCLPLIFFKYRHLGEKFYKRFN
jgi:hypothetical protein